MAKNAWEHLLAFDHMLINEIFDPVVITLYRPAATLVKFRINQGKNQSGCLVLKMAHFCKLTTSFLEVFNWH